MKSITRNLNTEASSFFDLKNMDEQEIKSMFMSVSIKSLQPWQDYYEGKEQYEICKIIKQIHDLKLANNDTRISNDQFIFKSKRKCLKEKHPQKALVKKSPF